MKYIFENKLIIFDLDNTLIEENEYLFSAYQQIATVFEKYKIPPQEVYNYLVNKFINSGRKNIFNELCYHFELAPNIVDECLNILRTFEPTKRLNLRTSILQKFEEYFKNTDYIFIITNGNIRQQKNKVRYTNWGYLKPVVIYAKEYGSKPNPWSYIQLCQNYSIQREKVQVYYCGDSDTDATFAKNCGIGFINANYAASY